MRTARFEPRYVQQDSLPEARREYSVELSCLTGGLNTYDPRDRLRPDESPEMKNLLWLNGALSCRDGQVWRVQRAHGRGWACGGTLFHGRAFFHIGTKLYCSALRESTAVETLTAQAGQTEFSLTAAGLADVTNVRRNGVPVTGYAVNAAAGSFTLAAALTAGAVMTVDYRSLLGAAAQRQIDYVPGTLTYTVLSGGVEAITGISTGGAQLRAGEDYVLDLPEGRLTLAAPAVEGDSLRVSYTAMDLTQVCDLAALFPESTAARGVFFRYGAHLYYKARGVFVRISYSGETDAFTAESMTALAYTPVTVINADAETGAGDLYQPENRLSAKKTVWYNVGTRAASVRFSAAADGRTSVELDVPGAVSVERVELGGTALTEGVDYSAGVSADGQVTVRLTQSATQAGTVCLRTAAKSYYLPVRGSGVTVERVTVQKKTVGTTVTRWEYEIPQEGVPWYDGGSNYYYAYLRTEMEGTSTQFRLFTLSDRVNKDSGMPDNLYLGGGRLVLFPDTEQFYVETAAGVVYSGTAGTTKTTSIPSITMTKVTEQTVAETELTASTTAPGAETEQWDAGWDGDYVFWPETGHVLLKDYPYYTVPPENNTVRITYAQENAEALASILDCSYAVTYGASRDACIVLSGSSAQPNAYFWNGSHAAMDAGYWPMEQYNLAGDASEPVTGFGVQYETLMIFKQGSIGKSALSTTEIDGRLRLTMDYTPVNSAVGCDLPESIRLVENNLVFCNTQQGVCRVASMSPALENNVAFLSWKVNGTPARPGLLDAVRAAPDTVRSLDDGRRYWLCAGGGVYVWDYELSPAERPAWFYLEGIEPEGFVQGEERLYHLNRQGQVTQLERCFSDYGRAIEKTFVFAVQTMGGYDRLKDVTGAIFVLRSDTPSLVQLTYLTDHEHRRDRTDLAVRPWALAPRNLAYRSLAVERFAAVQRRRPGCRHVRHFTVRLENNEVGADLTLVSAQFFWKLAGRDR